MLLLRAADFGADEVLRGHLSTAVTDAGVPFTATSGETVLAILDDWPVRAYVLCADEDTDTLNIAVAGPRE